MLRGPRCRAGDACQLARCGPLKRRAVRPDIGAPGGSRGVVPPGQQGVVLPVHDLLPAPVGQGEGPPTLLHCDLGRVRAHGGGLGRQVGGSVDLRRHLVVGHPVGGEAPGHGHRPRHRGGIELRHLPWLALSRAGRHTDRFCCHPVCLDVIGVAVEAESVVGDQHLRADIHDDLGQCGRGRGQVGLPEAARVVVGGQAHHARVAPPAGATEKPLVADAKRGTRGGQLGDPVLPEAVAVGGQVGQPGGDDLTELASRAGDQGDLGTFGGVPGDGGPGADRLVVGMGVHQKHAAGAALAVHAVRLARRDGQGPVTKERGHRGFRGVAPPG